MTVSADLRNTVARVLAEIDEDWQVAFKPADAVAAPSFLVVWGPDLMRTPNTFVSDTAALEVIVIAGRTDADAAHDLIEQMVDATVPALLAAGHRHQGVTTPTQLDLGGVAYLTCRIRITAPLPTRTNGGT